MHDRSGSPEKGKINMTKQFYMNNSNDLIDVVDHGIQTITYQASSNEDPNYTDMLSTENRLMSGRSDHGSQDGM